MNVQALLVGAALMTLVGFIAVLAVDPEIRSATVKVVSALLIGPYIVVAWTLRWMVPVKAKKVSPQALARWAEICAGEGWMLSHKWNAILIVKRGSQMPQERR